MTLVETILKNLNAERLMAIQVGNENRLAYLDEQIAALLPPVAAGCVPTEARWAERLKIG